MNDYSENTSGTVYQRGEFVLREGHRQDDGRAVLLLAASSENAAPASLKKLEHEFSHPAPSVLMLTAFSRDEVAHRLATEGLAVAATLTKPVTPSSLLDACLQVRGSPRPRAARDEPRADALHDNIASLAAARILLVEDNPAGIIVTVAENGKEALEVLSTEPFACASSSGLANVEGRLSALMHQLDPVIAGLDSLHGQASA